MTLPAEILPSNAIGSVTGLATLSLGTGAGQITQTLSMPAGAGTYNFDRLGVTVTGVDQEVDGVIAHTDAGSHTAPVPHGNRF